MYNDKLTTNRAECLRVIAKDIIAVISGGDLSGQQPTTITMAITANGSVNVSATFRMSQRFSLEEK